MSKHSPEKETLVQQDLDVAECETPNCPGDHPVFMQSRCHAGSGVDAGYDNTTGCISFYCHQCKVFLFRVLVGEATIN